MRTKPEIKVTVRFTEGYEKRYTAACLRILKQRRDAASIGKERTA